MYLVIPGGLFLNTQVCSSYIDICRFNHGSERPMSREWVSHPETQIISIQMLIKHPAFWKPDDEEKRVFTRVLQGHIAIDTVRISQWKQLLRLFFVLFGHQ